MDQTATARAAGILVDARVSRQRIANLPPDCRPDDIATAYRIQTASLEGILNSAGGGRIIGRKIGASNPIHQEMLGLDAPFYGALLSPFIHDSPAEIPADASFMRLLEVEFAFRLSADLPPRDAPYDERSIVAAVATVIPSLEIVDSRYVEWTTIGGLHLIADNAAAGHWVHGVESADLDAIDFTDHATELWINGALREHGNARDVFGNPLAGLAWLANAMIAQGEHLKAGEVVTTGASNPILPAEKGDRVVADFGTLGQVTASFV